MKQGGIAKTLALVSKVNDGGYFFYKKIKMNRQELSISGLNIKPFEIGVRHPIASPFADIIGPESWHNKAEEAASIMVRILAANYGNHNLTNNQERLIKSIKEGSLAPFINRQHNSCAALIKIGESDVEIGRVACMPEVAGNKSGPMLVAVDSWDKEKVFPSSLILRAEVRTAKSTREVPGGQATQSICLRKDKLGLNQTAIAPFFHHGNPDRQEMFILASKTKNPEIFKTIASEVCIPEIIFQQETDRKIFSEMWSSNFGKLPRIIDETGSGEPIDLKMSEEGPIIVLSESKSSTNGLWRKEVDEKLNSNTRFALARISLGGEGLLATTTRTIKELQSEGFRLVGFEPVMRDNESSIEALMGKLSTEGKKRLIMPCFIEDVFSHDLEDSLIQNSIQWRK